MATGPVRPGPLEKWRLSVTLHRLLVYLLSLSILSLAPPAAAAAGRAAPISIHAVPHDPTAPAILFEQAMVPAIPQEAVPVGIEPEAAGGEDMPAAGLLPRLGRLVPLLGRTSPLLVRDTIGSGRPWPTGPPRA